MTQQQPPTAPEEHLRTQPKPPRGVGQVLARRWYLVLLGVSAALGAGYLWFTRATPLYQATAQLLVVRKRPDAITGVDTRSLSLEDHVATQQALVRSPLIVERAIRKRDLAALPGFASEQEDLTEVLVTSLTVTRGKSGILGGDNVLTLVFQGTSAADCPTVLNAVMESYKDYLEETYRNLGQETLHLLTQRRAVLHKELQEKEAAYRQFRKETPLLLSRGKDEINLRQERLSSIETKRSALALRKAELQGQLTAIEAGLKETGGREVLFAQVAAWSSQGEAVRGTPSATMQDRLHPLLLEEQKLLETRGPKHPEVELLRKRIEVTRGFHTSSAASWPTEGKSDKPALADPVELYRQHCQQELRHVEITERLLADLFKKEHESARALAACEVEDEGFRVEVERQQRLYDTVIKQLEHIDLVKDMGGYDAQVIAPPGVGKKVRPNPITLFPGAAFLGLIGGLGLAFLVELWVSARVPRASPASS